MKPTICTTLGMIGSLIAGAFGDSIYSTHMAAFYPVSSLSSFAGRDEVTTQVTMTETPI